MIHKTCRCHNNVKIKLYQFLVADQNILSKAMCCSLHQVWTFWQKVKALLAFSFAVDAKNSHVICCVQTLHERILYGSHSEGVLVHYVLNHRMYLHHVHYFDIFVNISFKGPCSDDRFPGSSFWLNTRHYSILWKRKSSIWNRIFFCTPQNNINS